METATRGNWRVARHALLPKGRDEGNLNVTQAWIRRRDGS
jgi:hypothetical protein